MIELMRTTDLEQNWQLKDYHEEWAKATSHWDKWALIRQSYMDRTPRILKRAKRDGVGRIDPYWLPWTQTFTDIESVTWNLIRAMGLPLYPQYPILNYFVDFANPFLRVGLEVDGQQWHQDVEKDRTRDTKLVNLGWHIYRCTGSEVKRCIANPYDAPEGEQDRLAQDYYLNTVEGVLEGIGHFYGVWKSGRHAYPELLTHTLETHRLVSFPIGR